MAPTQRLGGRTGAVVAVRGSPRGVRAARTTATDQAARCRAPGSRRGAARGRGSLQVAHYGFTGCSTDVYAVSMAFQASKLPWMVLGKVGEVAAPPYALLFGAVIVTIASFIVALGLKPGYDASSAMQDRDKRLWESKPQKTVKGRS